MVSMSLWLGTCRHHVRRVSPRICFSACGFSHSCDSKGPPPSQPGFWVHQMKRGSRLNGSLSHPREQRKLSALMARNPPETASDPHSCSQVIYLPPSLWKNWGGSSCWLNRNVFRTSTLSSEVGPASLERDRGQGSGTAVGSAALGCVTLSWFTSVHLSEAQHLCLQTGDTAFL